MLRTTLYMATAVALMAGPAWAQDSGGGSSSAQQSANAGGRSASDVTCREITAMDTQTVPGILYFISGYREGERSGMAGDQQAGAQTSASDPTAASAEGSDGNGQTTATGSTSGSADSGGGTSATAGSGSGGSGATSGADMAAAGSGSSNSGPSDSGTSGSASAGGSGSGMTPQVSAVRGYFDIPVEQVMVACQAEPESPASDVMDRQRSGAASGSSTTNP